MLLSVIAEGTGVQPARFIPAPHHHVRRMQEPGELACATSTSVASSLSCLWRLPYIIVVSYRTISGTRRGQRRSVANSGTGVALRSELHCSLVEPLFHVSLFQQQKAMEISRSTPISVCVAVLDVMLMLANSVFAVAQYV